MTIDEAIHRCEEVAWENDKKAMCIEEAYQTTEQQNCEQCAADHRQLAEWLTELKQWRRVYGVCPSYEMCIPECKEGYNAQIAEYKRLLKAAVEDFARIDEVKLLPENTIRPMLEYTNIIDIIRHKWRYADEAEKLIES